MEQSGKGKENCEQDRHLRTLDCSRIGHGVHFGSPILLPAIDVAERVAKNGRQKDHGAGQEEGSVIILGRIVEHTCTRK